MTAVLTTPEARHNYWHWTFELLPRIHLLRQAGVSLENVDHFLINHGDHAYQRETLEKLKIPWKKVVQCNGRVHLLLEKAWIASPLDSDDNGIPAWVAGFVAGMSETKLPAGEYPRKIYVSRKDTALRRNIINEQEILPILKEHGFKTVDPGTMSMAEQQRTFASAEAVFGVNGAGLTNIAYCSRGAKVYVVYPYDHQRFCFWFLSSVKGLKYNCMLAEKNPAQRTGVRADMAIDADKLRELLSV